MGTSLALNSRRREWPSLKVGCLHFLEAVFVATSRQFLTTEIFSSVWCPSTAGRDPEPDRNLTAPDPRLSVRYQMQTAHNAQNLVFFVGLNLLNLFAQNNSPSYKELPVLPVLPVHLGWTEFKYFY